MVLLNIKKLFIFIVSVSDQIVISETLENDL